MDIKDEILTTLKMLKSTLEVSYHQFINEGVSSEELSSSIKELEDANLIEIKEQYDWGVVITSKE